MFYTGRTLHVHNVHDIAALSYHGQRFVLYVLYENDSMIGYGIDQENVQLGNLSAVFKHYVSVNIYLKDIDLFASSLVRLCNRPHLLLLKNSL